jgi:hypothetical protein
MKKTALILTLLLTFSFVYGQKGSEYRYFGIKVFLTHNLSFPAPENNYVLLNTPYGDMLKQNNEIFAYTPGGGASFFYNFDFKSDKMGIVFGLDVQNYGFTNHYITLDNSFKLSNQYRALQIGVPIVLKMGSSNIYKNQSYFTAGIQFNQFFMIQNIQKASWAEGAPYIGTLPKEEVKNSSISLMLGYNYNIFFINAQLHSSNYINPKYTTQTSEGIIKPYQHVNIFNNIYIQTGINLPLTRWLTARNWTAEQIRRTFKGSK